MSQLVLSLFPGIGLLDMAFEEEGFCVVRGPDLLWGGDIRRFDPPAGKFDGVIGGPPCQAFSTLAALNRHLGNEPKFGNLIPEFERCVRAAAPSWYLMENVLAAPIPDVAGYTNQPIVVQDCAVGGVTQRSRRFSFGCHPASEVAPPEEFPRLRGWAPSAPRFWVEEMALWVVDAERAVTGDSRIHTTGHRIRSRQRGGGVLPNTGKSTPVAVMAEQQGLAPDFLEYSPFTNSARRQMLGNGVPLPMGRAVARAVKRALGIEAVA